MWRNKWYGAFRNKSAAHVLHPSRCTACRIIVKQAGSSPGKADCCIRNHRHLTSSMESHSDFCCSITLSSIFHSFHTFSVFLWKYVVRWGQDSCHGEKHLIGGHWMSKQQSWHPWLKARAPKLILMLYTRNTLYHTSPFMK